MKITYEDKVSTRQSGLPRKNSVTAEDLNEIKASVNELYDSGPSFNYDTEPTESSENLVKSGGIWLWVVNLFVQLFSSNNEWDGEQKFKKPVTIVSDGVNPPLLIKDSIDTNELLKLSDDGSIEINKGGTVDGEVKIFSPDGLFYPKVSFYNNGNTTTPQYTFQGYQGGTHESESGFSYVFSTTSNPDYRCLSIGDFWANVPNYEKVAFAVKSTTKGVLLARGTHAEMLAITGGPNGLEFTVLDNDANWGKWMYNSHTSTWIKL